jgi:hypothetical protein
LRKAIIPVDLPRPRADYDIKTHPQFGGLWEKVWKELQEEVYEDLAQERQYAA